MRPLLLLLLLLAACGKTAEPAPGGVVSLLPSITEWVVELGAGDRLVACTEFCKPGRDLRRVAWQGPGAAEAIVRTGATLVLKQKPRRADDPLRAMLEKFPGISVVSIPSESIADARVALRRIGEALGLEREAAAYRKEFDARLERARAGVKTGGRPRVLMVYARDAGTVANISAAGPGSFLDELIRYAGGSNVLVDVDKAYVNISVETVLRRAPDLVIDASPNGRKADWSVLKALPAVRDGRVHMVGGSLLLVPGPRLPEAVARMVELIHGRT